MIRRYVKPTMNLRPLSVLSEKEIYPIVYYFYYFCLLGEDDLSLGDCENFFWGIIKRCNLEKELNSHLEYYIFHAIKNGNLELIKDEKDKEKTFTNTLIHHKYTCDPFVDRAISKCGKKTEVLINYHRCLQIMDFKLIPLLLQDMFFPGAMELKERNICDLSNKLQSDLHDIKNNVKRRRGIRDFLEIPEEKSFSDEITLGEINRTELSKQVNGYLDDLSDVRFLIDNASLSENEARLVLIMYRCETIKPLCENYIKIMNSFDSILQIVMGITSREYNQLVHKNGKLKSYGFLSKENFLEEDLKYCINDGNLDFFFSDLVQDLDCSESYLLSSFSVPEETTEIMKHFINGKMNSSLLFYGTPGSGKTEYAKALVKESGKKALIFKNETEVMDKSKALLRLNCYLTMKSDSSVLIVDEADKLLQTKDISTFMGTSSNVMKGTVNKMLENSTYRTIWIVNYSNQIDDSTRRRFNFSYKFEPMTERQLRSIASSRLNPLGLENDLKEKVLDMMGKYRITGASVENVVSVIGEMQSLGDEKMLSTVDTVLKENSLLVSGKRPMRQNVSSNYDLSVLNTSIKSSKILEMTENALLYAEKHGSENNGIRMLFYGMSGTGKTELARFLSEKLGKEILLKRASDIFGKYVGESEQNIRDAFEEAERTKAILLFDEADSFFADRNKAEHSWERTQVNEFLTQMEEFSGILICTTNLKNIMDAAMLRRFHLCVEFKPLDSDGIEALLDRYFGELEFSEQNVNELCRCHSVTPGDFSSLSGRLRFMNPEEITEDFVVDELLKLQEEKGEHSSNKIGFM